MPWQGVSPTGKKARVGLVVGMLFVYQVSSFYFLLSTFYFLLSSFILHPFRPPYPFFQYQAIPLGDTLPLHTGYTDVQGDNP